MHSACVNHVDKLSISDGIYAPIDPKKDAASIMTTLMCTLFAHKTYKLTQVFRSFYGVFSGLFTPVFMMFIPTLHTPYNNDYKLNNINILEGATA